MKSAPTRATIRSMLVVFVSVLIGGMLGVASIILLDAPRWVPHLAMICISPLIAAVLRRFLLR